MQRRTLCIAVRTSGSEVWLHGDLGTTHTADIPSVATVSRETPVTYHDLLLAGRLLPTCTTHVNNTHPLWNVLHGLLHAID